MRGLDPSDALKIKNQYQKLRIGDSEEEEFDPNELKLLPVLATDRNQRNMNANELRRQ